MRRASSCVNRLTEERKKAAAASDLLSPYNTRVTVGVDGLDDDGYDGDVYFDEDDNEKLKRRALGRRTCRSKSMASNLSVLDREERKKHSEQYVQLMVRQRAVAEKAAREVPPKPASRESLFWEGRSATIFLVL